MSKTALVLIIGGAVALLVVVLIVVMVFNMKKKSATAAVSAPKKETPKEPEVTLDDLLEIVHCKQSSSNDLSKAVIKLVKDFPFPPKTGNSVSKEARKYLDFVFAVASHPNSNAKLIAFMDKELKRANPAYKMEIDVYEDRGLNIRKKKKAVA
ncbi:MAG: hypothetical protein GXO31_03785 [Epsilonproteobacteria bacterium]|nr:hypothetical protein [Campylobacterota bacterium]